MANMSLPSDSEHSGEGSHLGGSTGQSSSGGRKRSSRACDQCRRMKSKCERSSEGGPCRTCVMAGVDCTFLGPSYKRGPPKGYINAVEQRWYQAEAILAVIYSSPDPRTQAIVSVLQQDELARDVFDRIDMGPFGRIGRSSQPADYTMEDVVASFMASVTTMSESSAPSSGPSSYRPPRQSRAVREDVSSGLDGTLSFEEVIKWQDKLYSCLEVFAPFPSIGSQNAPSDLLPMMESDAQTRDPVSLSLSQADINDLYTMPNDTTVQSPGIVEGDTEDTERALGRLSLDENQEVRYHGKSSGLYHLGQRERSDDLQAGGVWTLPMARIWPHIDHVARHYPSEDDAHVDMPAQDLQDILIDVFFTYIHPVFPVIHKDQFLLEYNERKNTPLADLGQDSKHVSKGLLLTIFSISLRLCVLGDPLIEGQMSNIGCDYMAEARDITLLVSHHSSQSTCQALLLLALREFAIGSTEQAWLYGGMAIRMAYDLGLNHSAKGWQYYGQQIFSAVEDKARRQLWWSCCSIDFHMTAFLGRPSMIHINDYNTELPEASHLEDAETWVPHSTDPCMMTTAPIPGRRATCFRHMASLYIIMSDILEQLYPVKVHNRFFRTIAAVLGSSLQNWLADLPEEIRWDSPISNNWGKPPAMYELYLQYWLAVLLVHRSFLSGTGLIIRHESSDELSAEARYLNICGDASLNISALVTEYHVKWGLRRAPLWFSQYIFNAGVMHIVTMTIRADNQDAYNGFHQCLAALKEIEDVWPSAKHARSLLEGVKFRENRRPDSEPPLDFGSGTHVAHLAQNLRPDEFSAYMAGRMAGLNVPDIGASAMFRARQVSGERS